MEKTRIKGNYRISDNVEEIDFKQVRDMLKDAFWSKDISIKEVKKGANNSALVIAAYDKDASHKIVGYLRVISDKTRFAYILDVYVDEKQRNRGIGKAMMKFTLDHPILKDVYQWVLTTSNARDFYASLGFQSLQGKNKWMSIIKPRARR